MGNKKKEKESIGGTYKSMRQVQIWEGHIGIGIGVQ